MSYDITVTHKDRSIDLNWLRNPFGLCNWACDNIDHLLPKNKRKLWYVCNHWSYSKSCRVNRKLFKEIIDLYWIEISKLKKGFCYFDVFSYIQFIDSDYFEKLIPIASRERHPNLSKIGIPIDEFNGVEPHWEMSLRRYKEWFKELVDLANLLQSEGATFYVSN